LEFGPFETLARSEWDRIPDAFKEGVDGLVVERKAKASESGPEVYTLGECLTESYPSDYDGPDSVRSAITLYWGSFLELAAADPDFDWDVEIWETLTHELRHHLESLAREDALGGVDAGMDQHYRRLDGEVFHPHYYRSGESRGSGWFVLEDVWFYETLEDRLRRVEFDWRGVRYMVPVPQSDDDVLYLDVGGGVEEPPAELYVIVVRRQGLRARLRAALGRRRLRVGEFVVEARRP